MVLSSSLIWKHDFSDINGMPCTNNAMISFDMNVSATCVMLILMIVNTVIYSVISFKITHRKGLPKITGTNIAKTKMMMR